MCMKLMLNMGLGELQLWYKEVSDFLGNDDETILCRYLITLFFWLILPASNKV